MARLRSAIVASLAAWVLPVALAADSCLNATQQYGLTAAAGYRTKLVLSDLTGARGIVFDPTGHLIAVSSGVGLVRLTLGGGNSTNITDVCVTERQTIATDRNINHGLAISPDGKTVYASSIQTLFAWDYDPATGTATNKKAVITDLNINGSYHNTRTLLIPPTHPDLILVQRGSVGNIDNGTTDPANGRAMVKIFNRTEIAAKPVSYLTAGTILGWGLRNSVGWGQDPTTGFIWSVENGMDNMERDGVDIHQGNPAEELNFHGLLNNTKSAEFGANYGYPECFSAWEPSLIPHAAEKQIGVGTAFMNELSANGTGQGSDTWCQKQRHAARLVFSSHMAPLDIKFRKDGSAAYVTMHGSWDKQPAEGYRVSRIDFGKDGMPKEPPTSNKAEIIIVSNTNSTSCPGRCVRPVHLAWDPHVQGRIFFTSDASGELHVIDGA